MRAAIPWIAEASSAATLPATAITTATLPATLHAGRGQFVIPFVTARISDVSVHRVKTWGSFLLVAWSFFFLKMNN